MNRKTCTGVLTFALVCLSFGLLAGCGSNNFGGGSTGAAITVAVTQNPPGMLTTFGTAPIIATVANDPANAGVVWTCMPVGACGTFNPPATVSGAAVTYTAPSTAGSVTITATSVTNTSISANASPVNVTAVSTTNYVFYGSGQDFDGYYAIAGVVQLDAGGNIYGGEQDFNDGNGIYAMDTYMAEPGALVVDPTTGVGTLTLTTSDTNVGNSGVETFAIQFVNDDHALISQFDGSATSSGSFDLQTIPSSNSVTNFAFAMSGVDSSYNSVAYGGVYTVGSTGVTGVVDVNDDGTIMTTQPLSVSFATPDAFGRGTITGFTNPTTSVPISLAYYVVGGETLRLIDTDSATTAPWDTMVGSAYGQGTATFDNTSLSAGVFTLLGQWSSVYATLGEFATNSAGSVNAGTADDNELDNGIQVPGDSIAGSTYNFVATGANGYGNMSLLWASAMENVSTLGVYLVDPALDINDPNNIGGTSDVGGALVIDLSPAGFTPGGMGVITPQTDTTLTDFNGNYGAGFQNFNNFNSSCTDCEVDMVGPFSMTAPAGPLATASIGAEDSDPFDTISGAESTGDTYSSNPQLVAIGYYSMSSANSTANPLAATIGGVSASFDADIYQASGTTLYWINFDSVSVFLGPIEQQGDLSTVPALKRPGKAQTKRYAKRANWQNR